MSLCAESVDLPGTWYYSRSVGCYMIILSIQTADRWCFVEPPSQPGRQVIAPCSAETPKEVEPVPKDGSLRAPSPVLSGWKVLIADDKQLLPLAQTLNFSNHCFYCSVKLPLLALNSARPFGVWI